MAHISSYEGIFTAICIVIILAIVFNLNKSRGTLKPKPKDLGFTELAPGQDPIVDIVAIHGLDGHREEAWTSEDGTMWLRDLLPSDLPNARILSYGYDADTRSFAYTSTQTIFRHAEGFAEELWQRRRAHPKALAICHRDDTQSDRELRDITDSTLAVMYFGTPHSGANGVQLAQWMGRLLSVYMYTNNRVLKDLDRDSADLESIQRIYLSASQRINTVFFYEEYHTPLFGGMKELIVPRHLAVVQGDSRARVAVLHADHCQMVKFSGRDDNNYRKVIEYLAEWMEKATATAQET
ncbi:hypothetical protein FRC17_005611 [Serendipita sp. 399]|nr:hypothetical protein FRC17_005611 [Serendipita sp. 399]